MGSGEFKCKKCGTIITVENKSMHAILLCPSCCGDCVFHKHIAAVSIKKATKTVDRETRGLLE